METGIRIQRAGAHRYVNRDAGKNRELHSPFEMGSVSVRDRFKGNTNLESHDYGDIGWKHKKP